MSFQAVSVTPNAFPITSPISVRPCRQRR
jgi:hypothetical protein